MLDCVLLPQQLMRYDIWLHCPCQFSPRQFFVSSSSVVRQFFVSSNLSVVPTSVTLVRRLFISQLSTARQDGTLLTRRHGWGIDWREVRVCWNSGSCRGWNCALLHSQGLSLLPSSSIIQDALPYLSSGYEPYSLKKHFIVLYILLSLPPAKVKRQRGLVTTTNDPSTSNQEPATRNQQPATKCYSIPFKSWWNDNLMLTMICPASQYSDVHVVNFDS